MIRYGWNYLLLRAVGRFEIFWAGRGSHSNVMGIIFPLVKIGLTDLSNTGVASCPFAPPSVPTAIILSTPLHKSQSSHHLFFPLKDFYHEKTVNSNLENQNRPRSWAQTKLLRLRFATSDRLLFGSALLWVVPLHYCWIDVTKLYQVKKVFSEKTVF